ncbi:MAG TPA: hypothetical protein DCQ98_20060 [Planctomycetaceae bacterium]|nr:hypothetical protein [Planctomycetaceae bacterium]HRE99931.1 type VI secretion system tube protein Hcp [Pirellulaceae bacterium]
MSAFVKFDGIDGSSTRKGFEKWVPVECVSQAVSRPCNAGSSGVARYTSTAACSDVSISGKLDCATPMLLGCMCSGKLIKKVEIAFCQSIGDDEDTVFYKVKLENVLVSGVSVNGMNDGTPSMSCSLNFTKAEWTFTKFTEDGKNDGNVDAKWDIEKGTK